MKADAESKAKVKVGSIVQITPDEDHGNKLQLLIVESVETWGVRGRLQGGGIVGRPWQTIEPTGGSVVFDKDGKRIAPEPPAKHHA